MAGEHRGEILRTGSRPPDARAPRAVSTARRSPDGTRPGHEYGYSVQLHSHLRPYQDPPAAVPEDVPSRSPNSMPLASLPSEVNRITASSTGTIVTISANG